MNYSSGNHRRGKGRTRCRIPKFSIYDRRIKQLAQCAMSKKDCAFCPFFQRQYECPVNAFSSQLETLSKKEVMPCVNKS